MHLPTWDATSNRIIFIILLIGTATLARGQDALSAFTNRADQLLRRNYGFGVNEIPIYCSTNPLVRYNGAIHYLLQQAANAYDQTNHTPGDFDFPSVFRPQFSLITNDQCVAATISNWVEVTNDYASITARPFKAPNDPSLDTDDNVWGIGLIVGAKPAVPAFMEFSCQNTFNISRKLLFYRSAPATRPYATNQFYVFSVSNTFGCATANTWTQALPRAVTIYFTNSAVMTLTNEASAGVTNCFTNGATQIVLSNQWRWGPLGTTYRKFMNSTLSVPSSTYLEHAMQFVDPTDFGSEYVPGFPVHSWVVSTTNQFIYALVDNESGRVLDFVSAAPFGSALDVTKSLQANEPQITSPSAPLWHTNGADTSILSPPSEGVLNQIQIGSGTITVPPSLWLGMSQSAISAEIATFVTFLNGTDTDSTFNVRQCPFVASASVFDTEMWWTGSFPAFFDFDTGMMVVSDANNRTIDEMAHTNAIVTTTPMGTVAGSPQFNPVHSHGPTQPIHITDFTMSGNQITLRFQTGDNQQYGVWSSNDLVNWTYLGIADQVSDYHYSFAEPLGAVSTVSYFQARKF